MKQFYIKILFFSLFSYLLNIAQASSISGTIYYSGSAAGKVFVAAFTDQNFQSEPIAIQLETPGAYTISELEDGVYYVVSVKTESSEGDFKLTDPWGVYGTWGNLTPVTISGGSSVTGIDITLVDGTPENPNPFYRVYMEPQNTIQLPETLKEGNDPCISTDGTYIYLYKHDYTDASHAKVYKINPSSGEVVFTYFLSLHSTANGISWIDNMTFYKGEFWATGGYGDPSGTSNYIEGIFKIDLTTSYSSNQLPQGSNKYLEGGFTNDGTYLYVSLSTMDKQGVVKFDPALVSEVPNSPLYEYGSAPNFLCFGNGFIWAALDDSVNKIDPSTGVPVACFNLPPSAAELYLNDLFWRYDEVDNTLNSYSINVVGDAAENSKQVTSEFNLLQNYPNPFNPSTTISFTIPRTSFVSLKIFDALGTEVSSIISEEMSSGSYTIEWNADKFTSGVYFYRLQAGNFTAAKKLLLLR